MTSCSVLCELFGKLVTLQQGVRSVSSTLYLLTSKLEYHCKSCQLIS